MTHIVGKAAAMLGGAGLSLVLLASAVHATAVPGHDVKASCTMSDGQKADFEMKYRTSGGYHRVSDIIYRWSSEAPIRLKTAHLRLMVERRGKDGKVFGETLHEKHASNDVSYDIVVDVKVPAKRKLYLVVDSTFVKKGKTMFCAGRTVGV
ncbi:hypothetical protein ACFPOI_29610 [Nonomuraea angiospora]|uniref:Uncharacterized protein n=1 Tax=Nonomuraea angiospora TaxID=46172 RepID=A0ABR9LV85_9ACTN|nr:hypothetical protein [Nonomuraea angiospora]MBE1584230.1 hypothetical protein [Nonomuraea angiospora]